VSAPDIEAVFVEVREACVRAYPGSSGREFVICLQQRDDEVTSWCAYVRIRHSSSEKFVSPASSLNEALKRLRDKAVAYAASRVAVSEKKRRAE